MNFFFYYLVEAFRIKQKYYLLYLRVNMYICVCVYVCKSSKILLINIYFAALFQNLQLEMHLPLYVVYPHYLPISQIHSFLKFN